MPEPTLPISGGCNCRGVRFEVSEPLTAARYCHCERCQRRTGNGFSVSGQTVPGSFRIVAGAELVRAWTPEGGWPKSFCTSCGSHLFSASADDPDLISVRLGAIDGDPGVRPSVHQFTAYAPAWSPIPDDGLPRYPERMPADAEPPAA